jgi:BASS family bile acid:Na+ symporter
MGPETVDQLQLNFDPRGLMVVNVAIGLMMLGVALDLKIADFKRVLTAPISLVIGVTAQFLLLPALTFVLLLILRPHPSIALGMILVAACPGGNLSNIMTYLAKGNTAISVSMTAVSTVAAIFMTPFNLMFWGSLNPDTSAILRQVSLSPLDVLLTVFLILGVPLAVGLTLSHFFPSLAEKVRKPFKIFTLIFFLAIVGIALLKDWNNFVNVIGLVAFAVFLHNALALNLGYFSARLFRLPEADRRAIAIEVGIQNSGLGLVLVFNFFDGLGGMAVVVAWWGIWHIIAGLLAALFFSRRALGPAPGQSQTSA